MMPYFLVEPASASGKTAPDRPDGSKDPGATEPQRAPVQSQLLQFIKNAPAAIAIFDRDMRCLHASDRWISDFGLGGKTEAGGLPGGMIPCMPAAWREAQRRALEGLVANGEDEVNCKPDCPAEWMQWEMRPWFELDASVGGLVVSTNFTTARKRIEAELGRANRALRSISRCKQAVAHASSEAEMLGKVCQAIVQSGGYRFAWVGRPQDDPQKSVLPAALAGIAESQVIDFGISWSDTDRGRGPTGTAIRTGHHRVSRDFESDSGIGPWRELARQMGIKACVALPLKADGRMFGALSIYAGDKEAFDAEEIGLLTELADDLVSGLEALKARADRLLSEEALRHSEDRFRSAMENSPIGMALAAISGRWIEVNPAFCRIVGYTREEMLALDFQTLTYPDDRKSGAELVQRTLEGPVKKYQREKRYVHKDGHPVWVQLNFSLVRNPDGTPRHFVSQVQDITGRRQDEQSLRDFQTKLTLALDMARLGHWEYDVSTDKFLFDQNFYKLYGTTIEREGGIHMSSADYANKFLPLGETGLVQDEIKKALETTDPAYTRKLEHRFIRADGSIGVVSVRFAVTKDAEGRTVRVYGLNQDITEQRDAEHQRQNLEEQLRQAQKMDALGKLAGGIAHDFNNILTGIIGNLQLAELDIPADHPASPALEDAGKASKRARDLVARILSFSRHERNDRHASRLGPIVNEALQLLRASLPSTIEIRNQIELDCPNVLFSAAQMHQVIMNLGTNAAHAMREHGGVLTVELKSRVPSAEAIRRNPQVGSESSVCLTVRDSGCGMGQDVLARIFEPFYTTKAVGEGTGLGLALVHNIVQNHDGAIVVQSAPGVGTMFEIFFPVAVDRGAGAQSSAPFLPNPGALSAFGNGRRVMLVDDEDSVRQLGVSLLTRMGFLVEAYSHPVPALGAFLASPGEFSAVVSDLTMPDMNGLDLARHITAAQPGIPFVLASGNFHLSEKDEDLVLNHLHIIEKPFEVCQFATQLRAALGNMIS